MIHYFTVTARDPIIARDSRPFGRGQGFRMRSLDWPYPSVLAGSLRTLLGKAHGGSFDAAMVKDLKSLAVAGPVPFLSNELYFPKPFDAVGRPNGESIQVHSLRPMRCAGGEGCDLPAGLQPVMLSPELVEDFKPAGLPDFWSATKMAQWLTDSRGASFPMLPNLSSSKPSWEAGFLGSPAKDERTHVSISSDKGVAEDGELFSTVGLDLWHKPLGVSVEIGLRVTANTAVPIFGGLHPFGGERRLAFWRDLGDVAPLWECPERLRQQLASSAHIRLVLATPAFFAHGWKPRWLSSGPDGMQGSPPGTSVKLRLTAAAVDRWRPISGWSLEEGQVGIKPLRRLAPAGSVYFFEVLDGDRATLARDGWLQPISDDEQDRRDGFGLALWGIWEPHS